MKIIHTSDWHIGQNFYRFDRSDEHQYFFSQLADLMGDERPDALVVSGDVFHNPAPTVVAQKLFINGVMMLHDASPDTVIVITAGNHDSGSRIDAESLLWRRLGIHVTGCCMRRDDGTFDPGQITVNIPGRGHIIAVPYMHPSSYPLAAADTPRDDRQTEFYAAVLRSVPDDGLPLVLMSHLAVDGCNTRGHEDEPVGGMLKESIDILGVGYDYLALGHIHMPQQLTDRAYYCGSPLPVSFSEDYEHYVNVVEIESRGAIPSVTRHRLDVLRNVTTIPKDGAPLDQALDEFKAFDCADDSYVRILVDQDDVLAADAEDRAEAIARDKTCRFCEIRRIPREIQTTDTGGYRIEEISDFNRLTPTDVAQLAYERAYGQPMTKELLDLFNTAVQAARQD